MVLLLLSVSLADAPTFDTWVARGDSAAAELASAATRLATTSGEISASGRAQRFAELDTQAAELVRRADLLVAALAPEPGE